MPQTSRRMGGLVQSEIRRMTRECVALNGINMGQGICDLPTPPWVADGAVEAIRGNRAIYSFPEGDPHLRAAIADKLSRHNGIDADPEREIVVTVGGAGAFTCALMGLLDPGDGILIMEPYYGYHLNAAQVAGLEPRFLTLRPPDFRLREDALREACDAGVKAVVVCTPANPSGRMFDLGELEALARVAHERDLLVITDEIYEYIRYDGRPHISPATVGGLRERTVSIMGLSKTFSITGWRIGYAVAPPALAQALTLANDLFYICAPTPLQHGVTAGFRAPQRYFDDLAHDYQRKRDLFCRALADAGLTPIIPEGAYYVLADATPLGCRTAKEAAMQLLHRTGVAAVAGSAFFRGAEGESLLRFCFAKQDAALEQACARIRALAG